MAKKTKWFKTGSKETGYLYFKKHETRKHGVKFDRYYRSEYQFMGKRVAINFGWASDGWTELRCLEKMQFYRNNAKNGLKPISLKEERAIIAKEEKEKQLKSAEEGRANLTFKDFFNDYYLSSALKQKKKYTVDNEKSLFENWIVSEIGHLSFSEIKPFSLEKIKKNMIEAGRAPRSIQYCFAILRQIWNYALINDMVHDKCPVSKVKIPRFDNKRVRFLDRNEAQALLEKLKKKSSKLYNIALLSLHTGARAGEIFSLTWQSVDLNNGTLTILDSKSGKTRYLYLTEDTKRMFSEIYKGQAGSDLVFRSQKGGKIKSISKTFDRQVAELKFNQNVVDRRDKVTFHTLRHTFASWHVQSGTDLYTVKELLGHSTIQLTERYSHLKPDGLKQAAQIFDKKIWENTL